MRFKFDVQDDATSFYNDPKMLGHRWAAETLDALRSLIVKVAKSEKQRNLVNALVDRKETDWHYFCHMTKKEISQLSYVLRRIDIEHPLTLLKWLSNNSGCMKSKLYHVLEGLSYKHNQEAYLTHYVTGFKFFGMEEYDAIDRFHAYHTKISEKPYVNCLVEA